MARVKTHDLRTKKKEELTQLLEEQKQELAGILVEILLFCGCVPCFQVSKVTAGPASKLSKIRVIRKNIARILTIINQTQRENIRKLYKVGSFPHIPGSLSNLVVPPIEEQRIWDSP